MKLSSKEEHLMTIIWEKGKVYMKDIMAVYPEPKPAPTTLATLLKRLTEKKAIDFDLHGNARQYFPLINEEDYSSKSLKAMISMLFHGSTGRFASFFAENANLSKNELEQLREIINDKIKDTEK